MSTRALRRGLAAAGLAVGLGVVPAGAASHREAPLMTLDPAADITDVYFFTSYDQANLSRTGGDRRVTMVLNAVPGQEPGSGPNYFSFDDNVLYELHVDNNQDGDAEDVRYQIRFQTEQRTPDQFIATLGGGPLPPVSHIDGTGSDGLSRVQRYTVTELRNCKDSKRGPKCKDRVMLFDGAPQPTVPSNIGPRTMPDYAQLALEGIRTDATTGCRTFAGQRAETFAIDLGAVFDTVNLRVENATPVPGARPPLPILTTAEDADDFTNAFGVNTFSGFNINTIAIECPASRLTADGSGTGVLGLYASTSRQMLTVRTGNPVVSGKKPLLKGAKDFRQVSRMANPLVNELIIPIGKKDFWNATDPADEAQFVTFYKQLAVAKALEAVSGVPVPTGDRDDIVRALLKYSDSDANLSELLRLDLSVPPTPPASIKRLTVLAHDAAGNSTPDPAGFPNGRRPNDDVTDLIVRLAGGPNYITNHVGDGVGVAEKGITPDFPFLPIPYDGRNRRHVDPGE
ncbi:MAG TPA: DUF4331 domain-containing protein [Candidatus Binatus sp.]|nr:DUF4331 domain-containing protein [Candidatus Binatus sp.]